MYDYSVPESVLESLFNKNAGLNLPTLLKRDFSTAVIQWSTSVVVHDLNDLNVFVITCFFTAVAYDKHLGSSFCISQVLSVYFPFVLIQVL